MILKNNKDIVSTFDFFISKIEDKKLIKCCNELKIYPDFWTWVGSPDKHHCFKKGLVVHTLEVVEFSLHAAQLINCNIDILITSCFWHDLAKIWEYEQNGNFEWIKNKEYYYNIHHVTGSVAEFTAVAHKYEVDIKTIQKVQHCILSHHGRKEWGSIKTPESAEAIILNNSDTLSALYSNHKTICF